MSVSTCGDQPVDPNISPLTYPEGPILATGSWDQEASGLAIRINGKSISCSMHVMQETSGDLGRG